MPAGCNGIIKEFIKKTAEEQKTMFTPCIERSDMSLVDGIISECGEECATLIIEINGTEKLKLKRGLGLGSLEAVDELH